MDFMLDAHSPVPLYYQLKKILEKQIVSGDYKPGARILSENQLCKQYDISRTTVRQAINELVNEGKLVRTQGRGTFVAQPKIEMATYKLTGYTRDMMELGVEPRSAILELAPVIPAAHIQKALHLDSNEAAVIVKRLRFANEKVIGLDTSYFPISRFIKLLDEKLENTSLYEILASKYNTVPFRSINFFGSRRCPKEITNFLELSPSDPIIFMREIVYDQNDLPFEYGEEYYRPDRYTFRVEIRNGENESLKGVAHLD